MNIADLANAATSARSLGNIVLVTPQRSSVKGYQPKQPSANNGSQQEPPEALLFHYEAENTVSLESDVTDHFIEDNTAIQDQVALRPEMVTVNGFIGELNNVAPIIPEVIKLAQEKLTAISAYAPQQSITALKAIADATAVYNTAIGLTRDAVQTWNSINGNGGLNSIGGVGLILPDGTRLEQTNQNKQQLMFQQFYGYWRNRYLFDVQTPWAIFKNMIIKNLRAVQDPDTNMITDFQVTFKMMRFASTRDIGGGTQYDNSQFQGRLYNQGATEINFGSQAPPTVADDVASLWS